MPIAMIAALALLVMQTPVTSGEAPQADLSYQAPIAGDWSYSASGDTSEAKFNNASGQTQLTIRCTRSTRRVSILKAASQESSSLWIWTSSETKSLPATFDPANSFMRVELGAFDPLLDAIASSRGRIGFAASGLAALVVPPWGEVSRVIEDCRV